MSWLFKSLQSDGSDSPPPSSPTNPTGGVKQDLSLLGETIGRQFREVATFLAPPPVTDNQSQSSPSDSELDSSQTLQGIRNDLVEIGGSFKSGLSLLSSNKAVSGFSKLASNLWQFQSPNDDDYGVDGVAGITKEIIEFVKAISSRSECWTDFPLSLNDDFEMSDAQRKHASAVECLVPSFKDLRINLHPQLGENQFWMIYFILLLPRLTEDDFELLSTPQIIETRNLLLQKLQNKRNAQVENSNSHVSTQSNREVCDIRENTGFRGKNVTDTGSATKDFKTEDKENTEQWLEEDDTNAGVSERTKEIPHAEDVVSFSDLEDESNDLPGTHRQSEDTRAISPSGSSDWIQLHESSLHRSDLDRARKSTTSRDKDSEGESSDWLAVDDFD